MPSLRINTLGALVVSVGGKPLKRRKAQALLVYLACHKGQLFTRTHLQTLLWSENTAAKARNNLRQVLYALQKALPADALILESLKVGFNPACEYWLDLDHVRDDETLYRGEFLQGFSLRGAAVWDEWLSAKREAVTTTLIEQWEQSAETHTHSQQYPKAIRLWQRVIDLNTWREHPHQRLIALHLRIGDRSAAITQYESLAQTLADELGVEPSAETHALYRRALADEDAQPRHNLPPVHTLTQFIGRKQELNTICGLLQQLRQRLLTLLGLGGIGKTRLAIACARAIYDTFLDGAFLIDLTSADPNLIYTNVGYAIGVEFNERKPHSNQLITHLRQRNLLLILDNFESVIDTSVAIDFVQRILREARDVTLLVTSRERLRLRLEQVVVIKGLAESAARLFVQVARRASYDFAPQHAAIERICTLVEGMPLAIEMAAAWTPDLSCETIADEIESDLSLLHTTYRDVDPRQRSLTVVFAYSWRRLTPHQQTVLRGLTLFRAGFDAEEACAVNNTSPATLRALVDRALLQTINDSHFRLHERLRQFVQDQWHDQGAITEATMRHANYYGEWLVAQREQRDVAKIVQERLPNIILAFERAVATDEWALLSQFLPVFPRAMELLGHRYELINLMQQAIGRSEQQLSNDANHHLLASLLRWVGSIQRKIGRITDAEQSLTQAINHAQIVEDMLLLARCQGDFATVQAELGNYEKALPAYDALLDIFTQLDNDRYFIIALLSKGVIEKRLGRFHDSKKNLLIAVEKAQQSDFVGLLVSAYNGLGATTDALGEYALTLENYQQALALSAENRLLTSTLHANIAQVAIHHADYGLAREQIEAGDAIAETLDEMDTHGLLRLMAGQLAYYQGQDAQPIFAESVAILERIQGWRFASEAQAWLGRISAENGDFTTALSQLEIAHAWGQDHLPERLAVEAEIAIAKLQQDTENPAPHRQTLRQISNNPATFHHTRQRVSQFISS